MKQNAKLTGRLKVKELAPASERLLALYPGLPFDRDKAKAVLHDRNFNHQIEEAFDELPAGATIRDLLGKFCAETSREEFLRFYIEAVTGENMYQRL